MKNLRKFGGVASIYEAAAYLVGFVIYLAVVDYSGAADHLQKVALLADNQAILYLTTVLVYILFGVFLVPLCLALYDRLKEGSPGMMQAATAFGLIWAGVVIASGMIYNIGMAVVVEIFGQDPSQAATVWAAVEAVFEGIGGGVEILGGLWILLLSWAAIKGNVFSKALNFLGAAVGLAGVITLVPVLGEIGGMIFGLGQIVWFIWMGIALLKD